MIVRPEAVTSISQYSLLIIYPSAALHLVGSTLREHLELVVLVHFDEKGKLSYPLPGIELSGSIFVVLEVAKQILLALVTVSRYSSFDTLTGMVSTLLAQCGEHFQNLILNISLLLRGFVSARTAKA